MYSIDLCPQTDKGNQKNKAKSCKKNIKNPSKNILIVYI